ncbi:hypothetical protein K2173_016629 [Erythroxylum novogranatense]|uniref:TOD1/MUCI70 glycosyltransferase-like domain-containing protein n=1 Tax=Erythroxylum novogranatense TaxID=1862640 RepID=A0AAV8SRY6_9ROSI|nr:hypothetical protein K2173_016629 [Erythroxylum novogranatense]
MTGGSLGLRGSHGSLQSSAKLSAIARKPSTKILPSSREKERNFLVIWRFIGSRRVAMLLLFTLSLLVILFGTFSTNKESSSQNIERLSDTSTSNNLEGRMFKSRAPPILQHEKSISTMHPCANFSLPPPPPSGRRRTGPRSCEVCYLPVDQAKASMPSSPSHSPILQSLTYIVDENPIKVEPHGGSDFGGYPSLKQRNDSFDIRESMTVHCGFVKGSKPGYSTGFDIDEVDLAELKQFHEVIVASAIFGNYDIIQQPKNISDAARKTIPFYMFIDEETESYMRNNTVLDSQMKVGLWRIIVVRNIPYADARRNGKVPKLLLHRILPNVRYSIWIDGKLQLVVDPYQILERFLWRVNANFAISRHYTRFDVFKEAEANKAAGKYDNETIDRQIEFYKREGLTPYTRAKLPITSDVPEGCVIIREHVPITNLFTCLWFNEVDRFTSRDQLSFSIVRDKIMAKVNWSINMFMDCERRNFVIQAYHRELLERMPPPIPRLIQRSPPPRRDIAFGRTVMKNPSRRGKDRKPGSKRHRKVGNGNRISN